MRNIKLKKDLVFADKFFMSKEIPVTEASMEFNDLILFGFRYIPSLKIRTEIIRPS